MFPIVLSIVGVIFLFVVVGIARTNSSSRRPASRFGDPNAGHLAGTTYIADGDFGTPVATHHGHSDAHDYSQADCSIADTGAADAGGCGDGGGGGGDGGGGGGGD